MAIRGNAQSNAEKWKRNISAATPDIQAGIQATTEAPGLKAAAQSGAYLAGVQNNVDKWKKNVAAVSVDEWKRLALAGVGRIAQGAAAKQGRVEAFNSQFYPHLERVQQELKTIPRGSLEQNLARMLQNARRNSEFKLQR